MGPKLKTNITFFSDYHDDRNIWNLHQLFSDDESGDADSLTSSEDPHSVVLELHHKISFQRSSDSILTTPFKDATAQITISVGCSRRHSGTYFEDTLNQAVKIFKRVIIMIDDSVQWSTLAIEYPHLTDPELKELAINNGNTWLAENQKYIDKIDSNKIQIKRWKDWENTDELRKAIETMKSLFDSTQYGGKRQSHPIRAAIEKTSLEFLGRVKSRLLINRPIYCHANNSIDVDAEKRIDSLIVGMSQNYLIEECAVMAYLWPKLGAHFELYPSERMEAMKVTYEHLIKEQHPGLLQALTIRFKVIKPKEQNILEEQGNNIAIRQHR